MGGQLQGREEAAGRSGWDRAKWMDGDGAKSQGWRWDGDKGTKGEGLGWGAAEVSTAKRKGRILLELTAALLGETRMPS